MNAAGRPLQHDARFVVAEIGGGAARQFGGRQVAHGGMRVVEDDLGRAASQRALDRGVHFGEQQPTSRRGLGPVADTLVPVDDASRALHVAGYEDLHTSRPSPIRYLPSPPAIPPYT